MKFSARTALLLCYVFIVAVHLYYPKWQQSGTEATLSYDVSGYYMYLPALFIYHDLREVAFLPEVMERYRPTADPYQTFTHESGRQVMKYSLGQAVMYTPFFAIAHAYATLSTAYPADGFSRPYQVMISVGSLLVSFLGLFVLMKLLLRYFPSPAVATVLILLTFGTNYLNYSAIDGAMTHNYEFTLYALLLWSTDGLYRKLPARANNVLRYCFFIGVILGLMALTRPTEILAAVIPLCWGLGLSKEGLLTRLAFFHRHIGAVALAVMGCLAIGSLQLVYWKYVTGDWLVYSYQDQGFDWLRPHLIDGLFSYKAGWLTYTPLMWLALIGFVPLYSYRRSGTFLAPLLHICLFIYVAFAWSVWWYGGSLGQRTMVQAYAVLAVPLAAMVAWVCRSNQWVKAGFAALVTIGIAHNLWFTHQAHRGDLFVVEAMNRPYYWRTLFTFTRNDEDRLLLDNPESYGGTPQRSDTIYTNGFDDLSTQGCGMTPITGSGSICLGGAIDNGPELRVSGDFPRRQWVRATVDCKIRDRRDHLDHYTQLVLRFYRNGEQHKERILRLHRVLNGDWERSVSIEARAPWDGADEVSVFFWNGGQGQPPILIDNLVIEKLD